MCTCHLVWLRHSSAHPAPPPRRPLPCVQVAAANVYDATSAIAESEAVVVGLPSAPKLPADPVSAGVGKITLKWEADQTNAFIRTT